MRKLASLFTSGVLAGLLLAGCARAPLRDQYGAMRRMVPAPALSELTEAGEGLPLSPLLEAVEQELRFFEKSPPKSLFVFGERTYTPDEYLKGLRRFVELGKSSPDFTAFIKAVREEFDFFEVYGRNSWGEAFITSYYEPLIEGSTKPTSSLSQPLYSTPADLVSLNLGLFDSKFQEERRLRGRIEGRELLPYFNREQIDSKKALQGRRLEICYVDPIEAFFLQVQGSGTVRLEDGKLLRINYAEKNGHPYESLSKFLKPYIPMEQMNLHTIEAYLRKLSKEELQSFLNMNPSYVFFQTSSESAVTYLGVPATDGRTVATDQRYFPKGALGFLQFEKPVFESPDALLPVKAERVGRFVLDQDIGGAITGGGRLDLFWGRGAEAKRYAGAMKTSGRLYYLAPKR
jgi:membrane-bound lytic murein transglycosylase A